VTTPNFAYGMAVGADLERMNVVSAFLWPTIVILFLCAVLYGLFATRPLHLQVMVRLGRPASAWGGSIRAALVAAAALMVCALLLQAFRDETAATQLIAVVMGALVTVLVAMALLAALRRAAANATAELQDWQERTAAALEEIRSQFSSDAVMEAAVAWLCGTLHVERVVLFVQSEGVYRPMKWSGWHAAPDVMFAATSPLARKFSGLTGSGALQLPNLDRASTILLARPPEVETELLSLRTLSARVIVPMRRDGRLIGLITLGPRANGESYTMGAVRFAEAVGAQAALSLDTAERVDEYSRIRAAMLRKAQEHVAIQSLRLHVAVGDAGPTSGLNWASSSSGFGGHPGEFFELCGSPGGNGLVMLGAKVPDEGFEGAVSAAHVRDWLRGRISAGGLDWRATAELLARSVGRRKEDELRAIRLFCGYYDANSRRVRFLNAGYVAPFLFRLTGQGAQVMRLANGGGALGGPAGEGWKEEEIDLQPGDLLVGCTESLIKATNSEGEIWGEARLLETVMSWESQKLGDVAQLILKTANEFSAPSERDHARMITLMRVNPV
jgi:hypothetical protein